MNGSLKQLGEGVWRLRYDLGVDAEGKRKQKMETFKGTKTAAQSRLRDVLKGLEDSTFVKPRKLTLAQWLWEWIETQRQVGKLRASTLKRYSDLIRDICKIPVSMTPLQKLTETHLERLYAAFSVGVRPLAHIVVRRALRRAVKERLLVNNPAAGMDNAPRRRRQQLSDDAQTNCWTADEARRFLEVAKKQDKQTAAFFGLALDTGARKNELAGLKWGDVDWQAGTLTIERQVLPVKVTKGQDGKRTRQHTFGPTKTGAARTLALNPETLKLLRTHHQKQSEIKMAHRTTYIDLGLVFAREPAAQGGHPDFYRNLGEPITTNNLGKLFLDPVIEIAKVKRITVHGLRHTAGTLMLLAGIPVHVVAARLGHADTHTTLGVYAHVLKDSHKEAAVTLGKVLHGA
jgi:integrase